MNICFDTTFLIEIEHKNPAALALAKKLQEADHYFLISTISVSEIMTGTRFSKESLRAKEAAMSLLSLFKWVDVDGSIAILAGEISGSLLKQGQEIDFQDTVIGATAIETNSQYLVTQNKKHFKKITALQSRVVTIEELLKVS